ncbi:MAG: ribbon-helix-helix domain-containing protein [Rhodospirillales bacterium]|nr:ribbon-helix-helix domain-containing protein [Rhodospirillales bacterium]MDP6772926.1 ribbon-helix-helix domain-containing protein [Rhodospirillales bacterium]
MKGEAGVIRKRSVRVAGHPTSVSVEEAFWRALKEIAARRGVSLNDLITEIDRRRAGNLSSAIRVFVLDEARGNH